MFWSVLTAELDMLRRAEHGLWHSRNPFLWYAVLQFGFALLAAMIGEVTRVLLFALQVLIAVWQLELVNYVEHYGLMQKHLGDEKYEHVLPRHSWNAAHCATNCLLINLQHHSDHHYKPDRWFPLLQTYNAVEAPQ